VIIALLCWGFWGIFDKKALGQSRSQDVIIIHYVLHGVQIPIIIAILNAIQPGWHLNGHVMFWSGLAAITYAVATIAYLTAMGKSDASYVLGTSACYPVISTALAVLFLGEKLIVGRLIGAAIVCLGVFAISVPEKRQSTAVTKQVGTIVTLCVALATIAWAMWGIIDKKAVSVANPLEVCLGKYIWDLAILPIILYVFRAQGHKLDIGNIKTICLCFMSAICLALGAWAYLSAMSIFSASYVISITACYPVLMYCLAVIFLKERFNRFRSAGIALVVLGGILVQNT
jgi:drug/metabolite transporter (DMT)-like permease